MKQLTAYNKANDRQIQQMFGKAMCAYANWQEVEHLKYLANGRSVAEAKARFESEYEATVRCIDMFVRESVPAICMAVIDSYREEFGI